MVNLSSELKTITGTKQCNLILVNLKNVFIISLDFKMVNIFKKEINPLDLIKIHLKSFPKYPSYL